MMAPEEGVPLCRATGNRANSRVGEWTAVAAIVPSAMFDGAADSAVPLVPPLTGRTVAIVHPAWQATALSREKLAWGSSFGSGCHGLSSGPAISSI
jgi:hypothetical protein